VEQSELIVKFKFDDSTYKQKFLLYHDGMLPDYAQIQECIAIAEKACPDEHKEISLTIKKQVS